MDKIALDPQTMHAECALQVLIELIRADKIGADHMAGKTVAEVATAEFNKLHTHFKSLGSK